MEELNKLLDSFLSEYQIMDINAFLFPNKLSQMIYDNPVEISFFKKSKVSIEQSMKYSKNFLSTLHRKYLAELDGQKNLLFFEKNEYGDSFSSYDKKTKKKIIYISYDCSLQDSFTITHEAIHATTIKQDVSDARNVFCEAFSFWAEMLQRDYFQKQHLKYYNVNDKRQVMALQRINSINLFQTMLVQEYLEMGYITASSFMQMLNHFSCEEVETINRHLWENIESNDFDILFQNRYVIGYLIACYLYDIYSKCEFLELNDSINEYSISDFLDYVNLNYKDSYYLDLEEESYQKIEQSYVKYLKKI